MILSLRTVLIIKKKVAVSPNLPVMWSQQSLRATFWDAYGTRLDSWHAARSVLLERLMAVR